ncbi:GIY-YIG nuclease family protein [Sphingomonas morindae]|uniref:GIY-YIG nuclease family protein n=1 Tax=Sphingomonas morindae TaxID=1541170 RepID=A0ABY4X9J7_9SPHN|nr:GIY-YIG nuclease family protein [Sphingomonas morindae]USI73607.1 GIY-YIG nuclease family protein [Sphingomonas morindae]
MGRRGFVYIMASGRNGTLYVGVTSDLVKRAYEHKAGLGAGFTSRYGCTNLVWFEVHDRIEDAIRREKQIKAWRRAWKMRVIEEMNPGWEDLFASLT